MTRFSGPACALALVSGVLGCGAERSTTAAARASEGSALTCSELAQRYTEVLASDASLCTLGEEGACTGRRPAWGVVMEGDTVLSYGLSECPAAGSGVPVNPARVERLDALLAAYREKGCDLSAGPGCGAPGWIPPVAACAESSDGVTRCR
jgi:hypothetical protein